jgi:hypothetical protein
MENRGSEPRQMGGVEGRRRRDGKELFFISPDQKMMAADVSTDPTFQSGTPHALFDTEMVDTGIRTGPMSWDIRPVQIRLLTKRDELGFLPIQAHKWH